MRIFYRSFPFDLNGNQYLDDLEKGLLSLGCIKVNTSVNLFKVRQYKRVSIVHFHFPEALWRSPNILIKVLKFLYFFSFFSVLKFLYPIKFVFTVHNKTPHYQVSSIKIELLFRKYIFGICDVIVVMNKYLIEDLKNEFGLSKNSLYYIQHGRYKRKESSLIPLNYFISDFNKIIGKNYILFFNDKSRTNKLDNDEFFKLLSSISPNVNIVLIEKPLNHNISNNSQVKNMGRYYLIDAFLEENEFNYLIINSLACFLLYTSITNSGLYYYIKSLNQRVVCSNLPFFVENCCKCDKVIDNINEYSNLDKFLNNNINRCNCFEEIPFIEETGKDYQKLYRKLLAYE